MEHILEFLYEGAAVWMFCMAAALLFYCSACMDCQYAYVKANMYEQHMSFGTQMNERGETSWTTLEESWRYL